MGRNVCEDGKPTLMASFSKNLRFNSFLEGCIDSCMVVSIDNIAVVLGTMNIFDVGCEISS